MTAAWKPLVETIPSLKGPIHLAAFLFAAVCMALLVRSEPNNIQSLAVSGSMSLALVALPLLFHKPIIELIPRSERARFILMVIALFLAALVGLGTWTVKNAFSEPVPNAALFDVGIDPESVKLITRKDGSTELVATMLFKSLQQRQGSGATVMAGLIVVHDQTEMHGDGIGQATTEPCASVRTCLGATLLPTLSLQPLLIPAGADKLPMTVTVKLRRPAPTVRIWWEFIQRESGPGLFCGFDVTKQSLPEAIPYVATYDRTQIKQSERCYSSTDMAIATL